MTEHTDEQTSTAIPHAVLVLDCSGSMDRCMKHVVASFNWFVDEMRNYSAPMYVSLIGFAHVPLTFRSREPLDKIGRLVLGKLVDFKNNASDKPVFNPPGSIAAFGGTHFQSAVDAAHKLARGDQHVMVVLVTDGNDGLSNIGTKMAVEEQKKKGWQYAYVGLGDGALRGEKLGFSEREQVFVPQNAAGLEKAMREIATRALAFRSKA